ncbi:uncharacterized protein LOC132664216 isoform X2 [Panthera onca]
MRVPVWHKILQSSSSLPLGPALSQRVSPSAWIQNKNNPEQRTTWIHNRQRQELCLLCLRYAVDWILHPGFTLLFIPSPLYRSLPIATSIPVGPQERKESAALWKPKWVIWR